MVGVAAAAFEKVSRQDCWWKEGILTQRHRKGAVRVGIVYDANFEDDSGARNGNIGIFSELGW